MRIYKEKTDITASKIRLTHSNKYVKSFLFDGKLIIISKKDISKTLQPRYDVYYNDDYVKVSNDWLDVKLICLLKANIVDTNTMYKNFTNCYASANTSDELINLIMEKLNET